MGNLVSEGLRWRGEPSSRFWGKRCQATALHSVSGVVSFGDHGAFYI